MSCIKDLDPEVLAQWSVIVGATCMQGNLSLDGVDECCTLHYVKPAQCRCMCLSPRFDIAVALVQAYMPLGPSTYGADT
jgi:hypothetical protein